MAYCDASHGVNLSPRRGFVNCEERLPLLLGHGCSGRRMLLQEQERYSGMLLEHERSHGFGMDALVAVCSWNTKVIMVWV